MLDFAHYFGFNPLQCLIPLIPRPVQGQLNSQEYSGKKITVKKTVDVEELENIVQIYQESAPKITGFFGSLPTDPPTSTNKYDVLATIKKVGTLFELNLEFYITNIQITLNAHLGKMLHLTIQGECQNVTSHLRGRNWNHLSDGSYIKLKARIADHMMLLTNEEVPESISESIVKFADYTRFDSIKKIDRTFIKERTPECIINGYRDASNKITSKWNKLQEPVISSKIVMVPHVLNSLFLTFENPTIESDQMSELSKIQEYGQLRGTTFSLKLRNLIIDESKIDIIPSTLTVDLLTQIAKIILHEALHEPDLTKRKIALENLHNFERVSRLFWKACSHLVSFYETVTLPKKFIAKADRFPKDIFKMISNCYHNEEQTIGTFYLNPDTLFRMLPSGKATPAALANYCGYDTHYDTTKPYIYEYLNFEVPYFKHPYFPWATALIDFISWPMIKDFSLLLIEDPLERPALAMPYSFTDEKNNDGKGVFILQRFRVDENNKEWWIFIDKILDGRDDEQLNKARAVCFLFDYNKKINKKLLNIEEGTRQEVISSRYLKWLNQFLNGEICEDLPSSPYGIDSARDTNRQIQHYRPKTFNKKL